MTVQTALSGPQILYAGRNGVAVEPVQEGSCRICGGPLLGPVSRAYKLSNTWTDEAVCIRRDSNHICGACSWYTTGSARLTHWDGKMAIYATPETFQSMDVDDLYETLKGDFMTPCVFLLRGNKDLGDIQKHIQWRTINSVTNSPRRTRLAFAGIQQFKGTKVAGVAEFDRDHFMAVVDGLAALAAVNVLPTLVKMKTPWGRRNAVFSALVKALAGPSGQVRELSTETYMAAWLASWQTIREVEN